MSSILTYIAIADGKIKRSSLEVLSHCKDLANTNGLRCEAVIIDEHASSFTSEVSNYGASKIYTISEEIFSRHQNGSLIRALSTVIDASSPKVIAFASTESTKDILGALAANLNAGVVADVSSFSIDGDKVVAQRPMMAAKIMGNVDVSGNTIVVSVRSGSYDLKVNPTESEVMELSSGIAENDLRSTSEKLSLQLEKPLT